MLILVRTPENATRFRAGLVEGIHCAGVTSGDGDGQIAPYREK
jgi:hypothetical protein